MQVVRLDLADDRTADAVVTLQRVAYAVEARLIGSDAIPGLHESVDELRATEEQWIGLFEDDDLVATLAYEVTPEVLDVSRLVVSPPAARRGLGEHLVRWVLDAVKRPRAVVSTGSRNVPALALYEKLGFGAVGHEEVAPGLVVTHLERRGY